MRPLLIRAGLFLAIWLAVAGAAPVDLAVGAAAAVMAALASLRLLPPAAHRPRPGAWIRLGLRVILQSMTAGFDIARRAFHPALPLRPGMLRHRLRLPPGPARGAFGTLASLVPGTLPVGEVGPDTLVVHCLDTSQSAGAVLAADEALLAEALGLRPEHG